MKKQKSTDMVPAVQRRYPRDLDHGESNAIPRCTEYDLIPDPRGGEQSFYQSEPGNKVWEEKNRP